MRITVPPEHGGRILRDYLRSFPFISGGILTDLKKTGGITVNGEHVTVRYILREGDVLSVEYTDTEKGDVKPVYMPLEIIYEDENMTAVNKPSGMPTHPSHGHYEDTLANALAYHYKDGNYIFRAVNRLDRCTSGIVLTAKNRLAAYALADTMRRGGFCKTYHAICAGIPEPRAGVISKNIKRAENSIIFRTVCDDTEGRSAVTEYETLKTASYGKADYSLIKLTPKTGRTHQLRVHMAYVGAPVSGDGLYGRDGEGVAGNLALHASQLSFHDPFSGDEIILKAKLPQNWERIFKDNG